eukprot:scaffold6433_cov125-Cylindrotheca_fusiformis.AAC.13
MPHSKGAGAGSNVHSPDTSMSQLLPVGTTSRQFPPQHFAMINGVPMSTSSESRPEDADIANMTNSHYITLSTPPARAVHQNTAENSSPEVIGGTHDFKARIDEGSHYPLHGNGTATYEEPEHTTILSLPIDSMHWLASFLGPTEWAKFGVCNKASNRTCREIFRRVQMHGFRCATEVVTAWKLGHHSDAKELCALYIDAGVPIYPSCLGHSYHTLIWMMEIEAKEIQNKRNSSQTVASNNVESAQSVLDRFYIERSDFRAEGGSRSSHTYLEEKCLHKLANGPIGTENDSMPLPFRRRLSMNPDNLAGRSQTSASQRIQGPPIGAISSPPSLLRKSNSHTNFRRQAPKMSIPVHRHLLDQHLLGRPSVDDNEGTMTTPSLNLSADFFHPHFSFRLGPQRKLLSAPKDSSRFATNTLLRSDAFLPAWSNSESAASNSDNNGDVDSEDSDEPLLSHIDILNEAPFDGHDFPNTLSRQTGENAGDASTASPALSPSSHDIFSAVDVEVYNASFTTVANDGSENPASHSMKKGLSRLFGTYQRRLEKMLVNNDTIAFWECILDFWGEVFSETAGIHYYDLHTPVPRSSSLDKFLTTPCPKAIGIVQCEIERIKLSSKKKGVSMKGHFFPTYEYRLFIRHRPSDLIDNDTSSQRDTALMTARNRGRRTVDHSSKSQTSSKKGSNNYFLYLPKKRDTCSHFKERYGVKSPTASETNRFGTLSPDNEIPLARLQSNFIGTEFQIFTPRSQSGKTQSMRQPSSTVSIPEGGKGSGCSATSSSKMGVGNRRHLSFGRGMSEDGRDLSLPQGIPGLQGMRRSRSSAELRSRHTRSNRRAIANTDEAFNLEPMEEEAGAITYTANLLGSRPRIMDVCIPKLSSNGTAGVEWKNYLEMCRDPNITNGANRMLDHLKQIQRRTENDEHGQGANPASAVPQNPQVYSPPEDFGLLALQNRPPWWNPELGSFVLNFGGRVSVASVKNFQLCDRNDQDCIMLQFGRIHGRHSFTMDFQYPLTAVQAFAIAISSLQSKISFG